MVTFYSNIVEYEHKRLRKKFSGFSHESLFRAKNYCRC
jgi:hypothetical protein